MFNDLASLITALATLVTAIGGVLAIVFQQRTATKRAIEAQQAPPAQDPVVAPTESGKEDLAAQFEEFQAWKRAQQQRRDDPGQGGGAA